MTFGGHLEVLRQMLFRILGLAAIISITIFCFKDHTWNILLAPSKSDFSTYIWLGNIMQQLGFEQFKIDAFHVDLIATDLSSQFMTHISTAIYLGLLGASPYILFEFFGFVAPALYENEKLYAKRLLIIIYLLFLLGVLLSYFVIFPISFRFLGTYSVAAEVHSTITLDSYIDTFVTLTIVMGLVFQLPIISFALAKFGIITSTLMAEYRRHVFLAIGLLSAIITPPDVMTLVLVLIPLYLLYEVSIKVVRVVEKVTGSHIQNQQ